MRKESEEALRTRMLTAYQRARTGPGGHRLDDQGLDAVFHNSAAILAGVDRTYVEDISLVLSNMASALLAQCADGSRAVSDVMPLLARAVHRLTTNNEPQAAAALAHRRAGADSGPPFSESIAAPYIRTTGNQPPRQGK